MRKIQLWSVQSSEGGNQSVVQVEGISNTETEEKLEELLVESPDLLLDGLTLVGRQISTLGGPLDLLGVDTDGLAVGLKAYLIGTKS